MIITKRRTRANTAVVNDGGGTGESTFINGRWRPLKDGNGDILAAEWAGLPLNTWINWGGDSAGTGSTRLDQQLSTPFGAASPYSPAPNALQSLKAHYDNFTGCGFDEVNGRFYHYGGGHAGGSNNMVTMFNLRKGVHTVVGIPTHNSLYPTGYAASGNLSTATYSGVGSFHHFSSTGTPVGDNKHCASHCYGGLVYVPGINELITARFGWYHFKLDDFSWRTGAQVAPADRILFDNDRGGIGWRVFYVASTQRVYMTCSGSSPHTEPSGSIVIVYDPATRDETTAFGYTLGNQSATYSNACVAPVSSPSGEKVVMWYFSGPFNDNSIYRVFAVNLITGTTLFANTLIGGRRPGVTSGTTDSDNPCQYIPDLDTILIWCTATSSASGGAVTGDMLSFNRTTKTCALFPISGTQPTGYRGNMNNKMRYWPEKKCLFFQTSVENNCFVIKLA